MIIINLCHQDKGASYKFETDVPRADMSIAELKEECEWHGIEHKDLKRKALLDMLKKGTTKADKKAYHGNLISFINGELVVSESVSKRNKKVAQGYVDYTQACLDELTEIINNHVNTTGKNKGKVNYSKVRLAIGEWLLTWELEESVQNILNGILSEFGRENLNNNTPKQATAYTSKFMAEFIEFVDLYV